MQVGASERTYVRLLNKNRTCVGFSSHASWEAEWTLKHCSQLALGTAYKPREQTGNKCKLLHRLPQGRTWKVSSKCVRQTLTGSCQMLVSGVEIIPPFYSSSWESRSLMFPRHETEFVIVLDLSRKYSHFLARLQRQ